MNFTMKPSLEQILEMESETEYNKIVRSIPKEKVSNLMYLEHEGAVPNWELDTLSYTDIRSKLEKKVGMGKKGLSGNEIKSGMPTDGSAAWIFTIDVPKSNLSIALYKHHIRKTVGRGVSMKIIKLAPVYAVVLINTTSYNFDWRVYNLQDSLERIKYLIKLFTGVRKIGTYDLMQKWIKSNQPN